MSPHTQGILITLVLAAVCVAGDYFLKVASELNRPFFSRYFFAGMFVYAASAFGWVIVMRTMKLAEVGVFFSVSIVICLTALGYFFFNETLKPREIAGVILAVASLILLSRFAE